jgi:hypothetical protein
MSGLMMFKCWLKKLNLVGELWILIRMWIYIEYEKNWCNVKCGN